MVKDILSYGIGTLVAFVVIGGLAFFPDCPFRKKRHPGGSAPGRIIALKGGRGA